MKMASLHRVGFRAAVPSAAIAVVCSVSGAAALADALQDYDEVALVGVMLEKCNLKIGGKFSEEKAAPVGKAAFTEIWDDLNQKRPAQREKNGEQADFLLKKRTEELVFSTYPKLIGQVGCAALEDRARRAVVLIQ